jgi:hypothetical protein
MDYLLTVCHIIIHVQEDVTLLSHTKKYVQLQKITELQMKHLNYDSAVEILKPHLIDHFN